MSKLDRLGGLRTHFNGEDEQSSKIEHKQSQTVAKRKRKDHEIDVSYMMDTMNPTKRFKLQHEHPRKARPSKRPRARECDIVVKKSGKRKVITLNKREL